MTIPACLLAIRGTCVKNESEKKLERTISESDESSCNTITPVTSNNKCSQDNLVEYKYI